METVEELDANALVDQLADKLSEIRNKTLVNTCSSGFRSTIEHVGLHAS